MPIDYICPVCGKRIPRDLEIIIPHTEEHIVSEIKKSHPGWVGNDGLCQKCYDYYNKEMNR